MRELTTDLTNIFLFTCFALIHQSGNYISRKLMMKILQELWRFQKFQAVTRELFLIKICAELAVDLQVLARLNLKVDWIVINVERDEKFT
jgi:hypothetical protein